MDDGERSQEARVCAPGSVTKGEARREEEGRPTPQAAARGCLSLLPVTCHDRARGHGEVLCLLSPPRDS